jgi:hypothetical protein
MRRQQPIVLLDAKSGFGLRFCYGKKGITMEMLVVVLFSAMVEGACFGLTRSHYLLPIYTPQRFQLRKGFYSQS